MATMSYMEHFNTMPDDIKDLVYSKITYPQSKELLQEIKDYKIYKAVLKKIGYSNIKPTLENVSNILYNIRISSNNRYNYFYRSYEE